MWSCTFSNLLVDYSISSLLGGLVNTVEDVPGKGWLGYRLGIRVVVEEGWRLG